MISKFLYLNRNVFVDRSSNIRQKLSYFATVIAFAVSIVWTIVLWISFIAARGYSIYIDNLLKKGQESNVFNTDSFHGKPFMIAGIFLVLSILLLLIDCWVVAGTGEKVLIILSLAVGGVCYYIYYVMWHITRDNPLYDKLLALTKEDAMNPVKLRTFSYVMWGVFAVSMVIALIELLRMNAQSTLNIFVVLVDMFAVLPAVLYILEHVVAIILTVVVIVVGFVFFKNFLFSAGNGGSDSGFDAAAWERDQIAFGNKKVDDKIKLLEAEIRDKEDNIARHKRGETGFGWIDEKATRELIDQKKREIESLKKQKR